jgi:hypothetical protein
MTLVAIPAPAQVADASDVRQAPRTALAGEISASMGPDDHGYFNFADYDSSTLRLFVASLSASVRVTPHISLLGEARSENAQGVRAAALYVRVRPWRGRALDLQAGRIPPIFGRYARRAYGADNPLIGWPLAYQYLTTLRPDAIPSSADSLLAIRGRGWRVGYPAAGVAPPSYGQVPDTGSPEPPADAGVPLVSAFRWDTGVQVHAGGGALQGALALTQGSLSNPRVDDDNAGKQVAGRVTWTPVPAVSLGASGASARFLSSGAVRGAAAGSGGPGDQRALGVDAELSSGHWILRGELIASWWRVPAIHAPRIDAALRATAGLIEMRYRVRPGLYVAARGEHLGFSSVTGTLFGGRPTTWDAPVSRVEAGLGYSLARNVLLKVSGQYNERDADRPRRVGRFAAAQLSVWF